MVEGRRDVKEGKKRFAGRGLGRLHPSPWLCRMWTTRRTPALVLLADVELEDYEVS